MYKTVYITSSDEDKSQEEEQQVFSLLMLRVPDVHEVLPIIV